MKLYHGSLFLVKQPNIIEYLFHTKSSLQYISFIEAKEVIL